MATILKLLKPSKNSNFKLKNEDYYFIPSKISRTFYTPIYQFSLYLRIISSGTSKLWERLLDTKTLNGTQENHHEKNNKKIWRPATI
jgi:hypothetical protein